MRSKLVLLLALAAAGAPSARADDTSACHCYRERTFDPARPAAADPYIVATARSSLLSAATGLSKRSFVQAVMTGTSADDLWIAHWAAARSGGAAGALLEAKAAKGSWRAALEGVKDLGKPFEAALARPATDAELASLAADDVLASRVHADRKALAALHGAGATTGEAVLAVVLAERMRTEPAAVLARVKTGVSWGTVLQGLGLVPKDLDGIIREAASR